MYCRRRTYNTLYKSSSGRSVLLWMVLYYSTALPLSHCARRNRNISEVRVKIEVKDVNLIIAFIIATFAILLFISIWMTFRVIYAMYRDKKWKWKNALETLSHCITIESLILTLQILSLNIHNLNDNSKKCTFQAESRPIFIVISIRKNSAIMR